MEARQLVSELAAPRGRGGGIVVADPGGSPLERYSVESVDSGPYGYREEVIWLELGNGLLVGLLTPAPLSRPPVLARTESGMAWTCSAASPHRVPPASFEKGR